MTAPRYAMECTKLVRLVVVLAGYREPLFDGYQFSPIGVQLIFLRSVDIMASAKAIFKAVVASDKIQFKQSRCLMTISVGQQTHEGERFSSTIDLINASFHSCVILIDDSLQRHTMALSQGKDADAFYQTSIEEGNLWLKRNEKYLSKLSIPTKIMRWDHWLKHTHFSAQQDKIKALLEEDEEYREAFNISVNTFLDKYLARSVDIDDFGIDRARKLSFDFVLEECAALTLWFELQCQFEVYPNGHNQAIKATKKRFVYPSYPDLLRSVTIVFRNVKQLEPQKFYLLDNKHKNKALEENVQAR